jgi:hypothetical protein
MYAEKNLNRTAVWIPNSDLAVAILFMLIGNFGQLFSNTIL